MSRRRMANGLDFECCQFCGATENLATDHIWPRSLGGSDLYDNVWALCKSCNSSKGARVPTCPFCESQLVRPTRQSDPFCRSCRRPVPLRRTFRGWGLGVALGRVERRWFDSQKAVDVAFYYLQKALSEQQHAREELRRVQRHVKQQLGPPPEWADV